jgi:hypothetical protein
MTTYAANLLRTRLEVVRHRIVALQEQEASLAGALRTLNESTPTRASPISLNRAASKQVSGSNVPQRKKARYNVA